MSEHHVYCECDDCHMTGPSPESIRRARLDAFAGQAMAGLCVYEEITSDPAAMAQRACDYAAALLAARDAQDATGGTR